MHIQRQHRIKIAFWPPIFLWVAVLLSTNSYGYEEKAAAKDATNTVKIKARQDHDFLLTANYYPGGKRSGGVIILHDCNTSKRAYISVANSLVEQGLHTLLLDLRGYGESVSPAYSEELAKRNSSDIVSYQGEMALITANWPEDLLAAYQYLAKKLGKNKEIAVVSSGCSSAYAVALAEKIHLNALVMITPKMNYSDKERFKNLIDIPSYFITSSNHQDSYNTAQELFIWNGAKKSKMQIFKGGRYNQQHISAKNFLSNDIALWLKSNLK